MENDIKLRFFKLFTVSPTKRSPYEFIMDLLHITQARDTTKFTSQIN